MIDASSRLDSPPCGSFCEAPLDVISAVKNKVLSVSKKCFLFLKTLFCTNPCFKWAAAIVQGGVRFSTKLYSSVALFFHKSDPKTITQWYIAHALCFDQDRALELPSIIKRTLSETPPERRLVAVFEQDVIRNLTFNIIDESEAESAPCRDDEPCAKDKLDEAFDRLRALFKDPKDVKWSLILQTVLSQVSFNLLFNPVVAGADPQKGGILKVSSSNRFLDLIVKRSQDNAIDSVTVAVGGFLDFCKTQPFILKNREPLIANGSLIYSLRLSETGDVEVFDLKSEFKITEFKIFD